MGLPIPNDWDGVSKCCVIVEWPASPQWWAIFLGFVTTPSVGRAWDAETGIVVDAQAVGRMIINDNSCLWEGFDMGCLEDLTNAINNQTATLANSSAGGCGCGGSAGAGTFEALPSDFTDNDIDVPSGYTDVAEYHGYKCDLAEYVKQQVRQSLSNISGFNLAGLGLSAVVSGLGVWALVVVGIPWVNLLAIGGFLLVIWAAQGTLASSMAEAISYIDNDFDICLIYSSETAQEAQDAIFADIDAQTFTLTTTAEILKNMFAYDAINLAFNAKPPLDGLPTGDCSGCDPADPCAPNEGNFATNSTVVDVSVDGSVITYELSSFVQAGAHWNNLYFLDNSCCGDFSIVSVAGATFDGVNEGFYYECDGTLHNPITDYTECNGCREQISIRSTTAWTLVIEVDTSMCQE